MGFFPFSLVNLSLTGTITASGLATLNGGISTAAETASGLLTLNGGSKTSGSAPVIAAPGFANGTASQLSDLTRDYMVYLTVTASGTGFTLAIGPTSGVANVLVSGLAVSVGEQYSVRLPAGWFLEWSATTATVSEIAVGC